MSVILHVPAGFAPRLVDDETYRRLCRSRDFLAANFAERVVLRDAAQVACLSPFHYQRLFKAVYGESPLDFVTRLRMDYAKKLLAAEEESVTNVCLSTGYSSLGTFSARFHELVGCSPTAFRAQVRRVFPMPKRAWHRFIPTCFLGYHGAPVR